MQALEIENKECFRKKRFNVQEFQTRTVVLLHMSKLEKQVGDVESRKCYISSLPL